MLAKAHIAVGMAAAFSIVRPGTVAEALPVIAGGLIETKDEIFAALSAGASAISTGKKELWYK